MCACMLCLCRSMSIMQHESRLCINGTCNATGIGIFVSRVSVLSLVCMFVSLLAYVFVLAMPGVDVGMIWVWEHRRDRQRICTRRLPFLRHEFSVGRVCRLGKDWGRWGWGIKGQRG